MLCSEALIADGATKKFPNMPSMSASAYWQGLETGAAIQKMSVCNATQKQRDQGMEEFAVWLHKNVPGKGLTNCLPEDVTVYLVTWWALEHGGCRAADGSRFAAPVSLEAACSHLAVEFNKQGRTGEWEGPTLSGWLLWRCCAAAVMLLLYGSVSLQSCYWTSGPASLTAVCAGNPMRSIVLQQFKKGYKNYAVEQGYKQMSARPWLESEVINVLQHLEHQLKQSSGMIAALLARDGFVMAVLWQTKSRGCTSGAWRLENIKLPTGKYSALSPVTAKVVSVWLHKQGDKQRP